MLHIYIGVRWLQQARLSAPFFFYVALRRSTGGYPNVI